MSIGDNLSTILALPPKNYQCPPLPLAAATALTSYHLRQLYWLLYLSKITQPIKINSETNSEKSVSIRFCYRDLILGNCVRVFELFYNYGV